MNYTVDLETIKKKAYEYVDSEDFEKAIPYMVAAALHGDPTVKSDLAVLYTNGQGTAVDNDLGFRLLSEAAQAGETHAYYMLASNYAYGIGTEVDPEKAKFWAEKCTAENDDADDVRDAQQILDLLADKEGYFKALDANAMESLDYNDQETFYHTMKYLAGVGQSYAIYNLSQCYLSAHGTEKDPARGFALLKQSAEAGYEPAYIPLAEAYASGYSLMQPDYGQARFWGAKAQAVNPADARAAFFANYPGDFRDPQELQRAGQLVDEGARFYQQGNQEAAFQCFMQGAELGNGIAASNLSVFYGNGIFVEKNSEKSLEWMEQAAKLGYPEAYALLAAHYIRGVGCFPAPDLAKFYAEKSIYLHAQNSAQAQNVLQFIASNQGNYAKMMFDQGTHEYKTDELENGLSCYLYSAKYGNTEAMDELYQKYNAGKGTQKDWNEAYRWIVRAALFGNKMAYGKLAGIHRAYTPAIHDYELVKAFADLSIKAHVRNSSYAEQELRAGDPNRPKVTGPKRSVDIKDLDPQVYESFRKGTALHSEKKYLEALPYLEPAARKGFNSALYYIGSCYFNLKDVIPNNFEYAIAFFEAASYRIYWDAMKTLALRFTATAKTAPWKVYAESVQLTDVRGPRMDASRSHTKLINEMRQGEHNPKHFWDASDAMQKSFEAKYTRRQERSTVYPYHPTGPSIGENYFWGRDAAIMYGNLDALCEKAVTYRSDSSLSRTEEKRRETTREYVQMLKIAAYLGHPYAMYCMGQYLDTIDMKAANACYKKAAEWGYAPAKMVVQARQL